MRTKFIPGAVLLLEWEIANLPHDRKVLILANVAAREKQSSAKEAPEQPPALKNLGSLNAL